MTRQDATSDRLVDIFRENEASPSSRRSITESRSMSGVGSAMIGVVQRR